VSEAGWGTDHLEPQKPPRRVPVWVWACGSGCLLVIVALAVLGFFGLRVFKETTDPETQWGRLAQVLPVEQPPPPLDIVGVPSFGGIRMWTLTSKDGRSQAMIQHVTEDIEAARREFLEPEGGEVNLPFIGRLGIFALDKGTVRIQGRELPYLRFQTFPPGSDPGAEEHADERGGRPGILEQMRRAVRGTSMHVDLRPGSSESGLFLQLTKPRSREPVTEEELRAFLEPFHVGPER
jgi:hypothetical protein